MHLHSFLAPRSPTTTHSNKVSIDSILSAAQIFEREICEQFPRNTASADCR